MTERLVTSELAGYEPEIGAALWRLDDARARTLRVIADMPAGYVDRESDGNSVGTILYHMALIEADWLHSEILVEPPPPEIEALLPVDDRDGAGILTLVRGQGLEEHLERLRTVRETLMARLRGMSTGDFHTARSLPAYDVSPAWVLHHLAQHEAEHRAELGSVIGAHRAREGSAGGG